MNKILNKMINTDHVYVLSHHNEINVCKSLENVSEIIKNYLDVDNTYKNEIKDKCGCCHPTYYAMRIFYYTNRLIDTENYCSYGVKIRRNIEYNKYEIQKELINKFIENLDLENNFVSDHINYVGIINYKEYRDNDTLLYDKLSEIKGEYIFDYLFEIRRVYFN